MSDLYDTDILLWSEHQAALLRRLAAGERLNERPDWTNLIEEVESAGLSEVHSVQSLLVQAMAHRLKAQAWPESREVPGWLAEARRFEGDAASRFTPSMNRRLDVTNLYHRALRIMPTTIDKILPAALPAICPFTLDDLLSEASCYSAQRAGPLNAGPAEELRP